jgi:hypothetical protein
LCRLWAAMVHFESFRQERMGVAFLSFDPRDLSYLAIFKKFFAIISIRHEKTGCFQAFFGVMLNST